MSRSRPLSRGLLFAGAAPTVARWAAVAWAISVPPAIGQDATRTRLSAAAGAGLSSCTELATAFRYPDTTRAALEDVSVSILTDHDHVLQRLNKIIEAILVVFFS